jgi:hypothetical protein
MELLFIFAVVLGSVLAKLFVRSLILGVCPEPDGKLLFPLGFRAWPLRGNPSARRVLIFLVVLGFGLRSQSVQVVSFSLVMRVCAHTFHLWVMFIWL